MSFGGLDLDTFERGTEPPFDDWEGDHTALVHVLWSAKHEGLTLDTDCDAIASMVMQSRWLAKQRHDAAGEQGRASEEGEGA